MKPQTRPLEPSFSFAGFTFPRYVGTLPRGPLKSRLAHAKRPVCGPYYHAPTPNNRAGKGFYLNDSGMPAPRWAWCDEVEGVRIGHTGWFTDSDFDSDKVRGLVFRLPHGRGFLAGASMGEGMCAQVEYTVYSDEAEAARAADGLAERWAQLCLEDAEVAA